MRRFRLGSSELVGLCYLLMILPDLILACPGPVPSKVTLETRFDGQYMFPLWPLTRHR